MFTCIGDSDGDDDGDDDGDRSMGVTARPTKLPSEASPNRPPSETPTRRAIHLPVCLHRQKSSKSPICCVLLNLLCFGRNWSITGFLPSRSFPAHHRVYLIITMVMIIITMISMTLII